VLYLANPCGPAVIEEMIRGSIGYIDTPAQRNLRPPGIYWCADNGCFGKGYPGDTAWLAWLAKHSGDADTAMFATAPDVVGDAAATLLRSAPWLPRIRQLGYPAALVAQNGLEALEVPWGSFDCLFLGGSKECTPCRFVWPSAGPNPQRYEQCPHCQQVLTEWKLGPAAARLVQLAQHHGKWVHMGRVNSKIRYDYARSIGCDSVDGTYLTFGPHKNLPKLLSWAY